MGRNPDPETRIFCPGSTVDIGSRMPRLTANALGLVAVPRPVLTEM
jgi:hypothetical protein